MSEGIDLLCASLPVLVLDRILCTRIQPIREFVFEKTAKGAPATAEQLCGNVIASGPLPLNA